MKRTLSGLRLALLAATLQAARADVIYTGGIYTGGTYDVISQVYGIIDLEGGATLNARASGSILGSGQQRAYAIELNNGQVNNYGATIAGGVYSGSWAYGITLSGGTANLYSGNVRGGQGYWADGVSVNGGTLNLYGGTVSGGSGVIDASGISVNGGTVNLYGGSVQAGSAHVAHGLDLNQGTVNIFGSGFNYDLGPLSTLEGTLTGTLSDGTPLDLTFSQAISGAIVLIPEPSGCALLALGLLAIFTNLASRSKRRPYNPTFC